MKVHLPKSFLLALVALFVTTVCFAQRKPKPQPYATQVGGVLTFYYDADQKTRVADTIYGMPTEKEKIPGWAGQSSKKPNTTVVEAVFDESFKDYKPTTLLLWFYNCQALETIKNIQNLNTEEVTNTANMFNGCEKLTAIDLSNFKTDKVEYMNTMFALCGITSIDLSTFNTEKVKDFSFMFYGCTDINTINLANFNTAKAEDTRAMFAYCYKLQTLNIDNFTSEALRDCALMFSGSMNLKTIYCNNTWSCTGDSNSMFGDCKLLEGAAKYDETKVDIAMANPENGYFTSNKTNIANTTNNNQATVEAIYNIKGQKVDQVQKGINILKMSDGTTRKVMQ